MAFRKKFIRRKRFARKKRSVKKGTFKRYTKKRIVRRKRVTRRGTWPKVNASLNIAKFKIRVNRTEEDLGDDPEIIHIGNPADLQYSALAGNLPILGNYNQWRIDKIVTHWRMKQKYGSQFYGDLVNHALVYNVPNDSSGADGSLENLMFSTNTGFMNNVLQNYTQLRGVHFKKVSYKSGSYSYRPYVTERIQTLAKNSTVAPLVIDDVRRNYSKTFRYASSAVRYEAPLFMMVPGLTKKVMDYNGTIGADAVDIRGAIDDFPKLEIWSDVYVTAKQCKNFSSLVPPNVARLPQLEPEANEINTDFNKIKQDVQHSVMDHITNSNPVFAAVASVAGLRKRPRDEFKM